MNMDKNHVSLVSEIDKERIEIELLLEGIFQIYGYDFRNYAYSSIRRRLWYRAQLENVKTISDLQSKVFYQSELMGKLLVDFSINVTEMFRDPSFFKTFRTEIIPILHKMPEIKIWHAGCSSGEEVYSMAIILYEEGLYHKTKIYATDMNEQIIDRAKDGKVRLEYLKHYTKNYQESGGSTHFSQYYSVEKDYAVIKSHLKENIIFAHHNLVTDHSFNEFQIIVCRNVLIYFNETLTRRVYNLFFESLSKNGFLAIGKKESINLYGFLNDFEEINSSEKIYRKI